MSKTARKINVQYTHIYISYIFQRFRNDKSQVGFILYSVFSIHIHFGIPIYEQYQTSEVYCSALFPG